MAVKQKKVVQFESYLEKKPASKVSDYDQLKSSREAKLDPFYKSVEDDIRLLKALIASETRAKFSSNRLQDALKEQPFDLSQRDVKSETRTFWFYIFDLIFFVLPIVALGCFIFLAVYLLASLTYGEFELAINSFSGVILSLMAFFITKAIYGTKFYKT